MALPTRALNLKSPRDNVFVNGQLDYALTLDQTIRFGYNAVHLCNQNAGVGGYDEPERAFSTHTTSQATRVQHFGPVGRRAFSRSRVQFSWANSGSASATEAPTIRVLDAFTRGGAQRAGGDRSRVVNVGSDLDYVIGRHSGMSIQRAVIRQPCGGGYEALGRNRDRRVGCALSRLRRRRQTPGA